MERREMIEKKEYTEPLLIEYGDVNVLTLGS
jgi:hypothetical protein